ncbi:MAG TPA: hypothetical protein VLF89_04650 [Candidatus Saccharimonadales bacterium]|nr:hypothetical protein [Candidatus Saccharimonadales bacterium]
MSKFERHVTGYKDAYAKVGGGIDLSLGVGALPQSRLVFDKEFGVVRRQPRPVIDISAESGVANVPFLRRGAGYYDANGLHYIKTEPLGKCVALTLYAPDIKFGQFSHSAIITDARQGTKDAITSLLDMGHPLDAFEARMVGGRKDKVTGSHTESAFVAEQIWDVISQHKIPLVEVDLFGDTVRSVALSLREGTLFDYPFTEFPQANEGFPIALDYLPPRALPM